MYPIITSLLDTDFYKLTMGQLVEEKHRDTQVVYGMKNRTTAVRLADLIDPRELRAQLDHLQGLRFTPAEIEYLRGVGLLDGRMFTDRYLRFLEALRLPDYDLTVHDGQFCLEFAGDWAEAIYWETQALPIVSQLYAETQFVGKSVYDRQAAFDEGRRRLLEKIEILRKYPWITICDFGTRRRPFDWWHEEVILTLATELPGTQFLGTSNVYLAMKHGLTPMGTSAHELYMVYAALAARTDAALRASHNLVLRDWWEMYGQPLSIALTDTYGTDFFFRDMTEEQARNWKGLRHDSGDPIAFGERAIAFYQRYGIDPREKVLVFSDGLDLPTIIKIAEHFRGRIKVTFGWGTNLTNDLGLRTLSLVIKIIRAGGNPAVKLSDNIAKAMGEEDEIRRYLRAFDYRVTLREECRY